MKIQKNRSIFDLEKFLDLYLMKIQIYFCFGKIFKFVFNENTNLFLFYSEKFLEKFSNLYLVKIQTCVCFKENFRSVFNENTDLCLFLKKKRL